jgi:hypothetical protein
MKNEPAAESDALLPAILQSSLGFDPAGDRAESDPIKVNQTKSNQFTNPLDHAFIRLHMIPARQKGEL